MLCSVETTDFNPDCTYCNGLINNTLKLELPDGTKCDRWWYENDNILAVLAPEQYTLGHTLIILKPHRSTICDPVLRMEECSALMYALHTLSTKLLIELPGRPERIYVASLCDGIDHLHFHLIPRYNIQEDQKAMSFYRDVLDRKRLKENIRNEEILGGYWYPACMENEYNHDFHDKESRNSGYAHNAVSIETLARFLRGRTINKWAEFRKTLTPRTGRIKPES